MDQPFLTIAANAAEKFVGATSPNPPVGACVVLGDQILGLGAHEKAGSAHAEINALKSAAEKFGSEALRKATLYVTLEPCNHFGRTPPCTHAILESGVKRVVFAEKDRNKNVAGGGAGFLRSKGVEVVELANEASRKLNAPFLKRTTTGLPWVVMKQALREDSDAVLTMIPSRERGKTTFSSETSLRLAHELRRSSDAIITGRGTIINDFPQFNVRLLHDHPEKKRAIAVVTRARGEIPLEWIELQSRLGHELLFFSSPLEALKGLAERGALRVLVEGGPTLVSLFEKENLWDERLRVLCAPGLADRLEWERR